MQIEPRYDNGKLLLVDPESGEVIKNMTGLSAQYDVKGRVTTFQASFICVPNQRKRAE